MKVKDLYIYMALYIFLGHVPLSKLASFNFETLLVFYLLSVSLFDRAKKKKSERARNPNEVVLAVYLLFFLSVRSTFFFCLTLD